MKTKEQREAILAHLEALRAKNGGRLTPEAVVRDAKRPSSPLHGEFQWNVNKAANEHWLEQARELIRSFQSLMTTVRTTVAVPYYVRDPAAGPGEQGYRPTIELRSEGDLKREVLLEEFGRAAAALRRARAIAVAFEMEGKVDAVVREIDTLRTTVTAGVEGVAV